MPKGPNNAEISSANKSNMKSLIACGAGGVLSLVPVVTALADITAPVPAIMGAAGLVYLLTSILLMKPTGESLFKIGLTASLWAISANLFSVYLSTQDQILSAIAIVGFLLFLCFAGLMWFKSHYTSDE